MCVRASILERYLKNNRLSPKTMVQKKSGDIQVISHPHAKSDIVRPTSVDQVIHANLKMCRIV